MSFPFPPCTGGRDADNSVPTSGMLPPASHQQHAWCGSLWVMTRMSKSQKCLVAHLFDAARSKIFQSLDGQRSQPLVSGGLGNKFHAVRYRRPLGKLCRSCKLGETFQGAFISKALAKDFNRNECSHPIAILVEGTDEHRAQALTLVGGQLLPAIVEEFPKSRPRTRLAIHQPR